MNPARQTSVAKIINWKFLNIEMQNLIIRLQFFVYQSWTFFFISQLSVFFEAEPTGLWRLWRADFLMGRQIARHPYRRQQYSHLSEPAGCDELDLLCRHGSSGHNCGGGRHWKTAAVMGSANAGKNDEATRPQGQYQSRQVVRRREAMRVGLVRRYGATLEHWRTTRNSCPRIENGNIFMFLFMSLRKIVQWP